MLWEAIRGDVENLTNYKQCEKDRIQHEFEESIDYYNTEAKRELAYLEAEDALGAI